MDSSYRQGLKDMTRLAVKAVVFVAIFALLDYGLYLGLYRLNYRYSREMQSVYRLYEGDIDADILCSGSSRMMMQIVPSTLETLTGLSCYNIGHEGISFQMQRFLTKECFRFNPRPRILVFEADLESLDVGRLTFRKHLLRPFYWKSEAVAALFGETYFERWGYGLSRVSAFDWSDLGYLWYLPRPPIDPTTPAYDGMVIYHKGFTLTRQQWAQMEVFRRRDLLYTPRQHVEFNSWVSWLNAQEQCTLLLSMPRFRIRDNMEPDVYNFVFESFEKICYYLPHAHYLNLALEEELTRNPDLWVDPGHLTIRGARILTRQLADRVRLIDDLHSGRLLPSASGGARR